MRSLIALATITGIVLLADVDAYGPPKKEDVPKFITVLKTSNDAKARIQAVDDIAYRGAIRASDVDIAIGPIISALKNDKNADVRTACAKALGNVGTNADKCVPALTEALKDSAAKVKIGAAKALAQYGTEARSALPVLMDLVKLKNGTKDEKKIGQAANQALKAIQAPEKKKG